MKISKKWIGTLSGTALMFLIASGTSTIDVYATNEVSATLGEEISGDTVRNSESLAVNLENEPPENLKVSSDDLKTTGPELEISPEKDPGQARFPAPPAPEEETKTLNVNIKYNYSDNDKHDPNTKGQTQNVYLYFPFKGIDEEGREKSFYTELYEIETTIGSETLFEIEIKNGELVDFKGNKYTNVEPDYHHPLTQYNSEFNNFGVSHNHSKTDPYNYDIQLSQNMNVSLTTKLAEGSSLLEEHKNNLIIDYKIKKTKDGEETYPLKNRAGKEISVPVIFQDMKENEHVPLYNDNVFFDAIHGNILDLFAFGRKYQDYELIPMFAEDYYNKTERERLERLYDLEMNGNDIDGWELLLTSKHVTWMGEVVLDGEVVETQVFNDAEREASHGLQVLANTYNGNPDYRLVDTERDGDTFRYIFKSDVTWIGEIVLDGEVVETKEFSGTYKEASHGLQVLANTYNGNPDYQLVDTERGGDTFRYIFKSDVTWTGEIVLDGEVVETKEFSGTYKEASHGLQVLANTYNGNPDYQLVDTEREGNIFRYIFETQKADQPLTPLEPSTPIIPTPDKPSDEGDKPSDEGDKPSDEGEKPSDTESEEVESHVSQDTSKENGALSSSTLPETGENTHTMFSGAALSILVGLGLVTLPLKKEEQ